MKNCNYMILSSYEGKFAESNPIGSFCWSKSTEKYDTLLDWRNCGIFGEVWRTKIDFFQTPVYIDLCWCYSYKWKTNCLFIQMCEHLQQEDKTVWKNNLLFHLEMISWLLMFLVLICCYEQKGKIVESVLFFLCK